MNKRPLEILIFGTGAVGSTLGWRLAQNPYTRLSVVCRSNYDAVKRHGIQLRTSLWGNGQFRPHRVLTSTLQVHDVPFDYVVCTNKVTSLESDSFIHAIAPAVSRGTTLVSAQNGIGVETPLRQAFRANTILSAVCYISCLQPSPGLVQQVSSIRPHALHIGTFDERHSSDRELDHARLERFVALDPKFKLVSDVQAERWTKQVFNGSWNPATAISGLDTHGLLAAAGPQLGVVEALAREIFTVAVRIGVALPRDLPQRTVQFARDNPPIAPSMLQDARVQRQMEVESLCGNIVRLADAVGVPVPTVKATYRTLLGMNRRFQALEQPVRMGDFLAQRPAVSHRLTPPLLDRIPAVSLAG
ncbi:uncharacterized protein K452DRAFT_279042 [Aplosporella prunicola CBS 121167]|uniref:2-dehydropantoate 2-reductase n=1 Tax=Aplosporella prunicola CBS 121167 TaxID=1176127 RepID=A0A6A6B373_9PEZI|nr:uncharacterized protein K452DRAFT_279042 [Aplosporella prunicola CBS 121167]KAF2137181.1 hypothetical protein K452DRAFT_279042 [Aplosporella prunicola CBS 121167]